MDHNKIQIIPHDRPIEEILLEYQKKSFDNAKKYFKWIGSLGVTIVEYAVVATIYYTLYGFIGFERTILLLALAIFLFVVRLTKEKKV